MNTPAPTPTTILSFCAELRGSNKHYARGFSGKWCHPARV